MRHQAEFFPLYFRIRAGYNTRGCPLHMELIKEAPVESERRVVVA
jgi:hypothetical protein